MLGALAGVIDSDSIFKQFDLAGRRAVVAAVSGGSDSLALLFLLKDFLDRSAPQTRLVAVTIDHGLRTEAARRGRGCRRALPCARHRASDIALDGVEAGGRASGRGARGALPAARRGRGSGRHRPGADRAHARRPDRNGRHAPGARAKGLATGAGWPAWRRQPCMTGASGSCGRCSIPAARRCAIFCASRDIAWIDDPTNVDAKYERARLRATAPRSDSGLAPIAAAARQRIELGAAAARLIRTHARLAAPGLIAIDRGFAAAADRDAAVYALRILLAAAGGSRAFARSRACRHAFRPAAGRRIPRDAVARGGRCAARRDLRQAGKSRPAGRRGRPGPAISGTAATGSAQLPDGATIAPLGLAHASALLARHQEDSRRQPFRQA